MEHNRFLCDREFFLRNSRSFGLFTQDSHSQGALSADNFTIIIERFAALLRTRKLGTEMKISFFAVFFQS